jgi:hypothetical protein
MGNPAVRDYWGASGNVTMVEMISHLANRKSEIGNPPPKAGAGALSRLGGVGSVASATPVACRGFLCNWRKHEPDTDSKEEVHFQRWFAAVALVWLLWVCWSVGLLGDISILP